MATPQNAIERRTEDMLIAYLAPSLPDTLISETIQLHNGMDGTQKMELPTVAVEAGKVEEEIQGSGVYRASMQIQALTHRLKDKDSAKISAIVGAIRTALQQDDLPASLEESAGADATIHAAILAEAQFTQDGNHRYWTQALDVVWSPTDD